MSPQSEIEGRIASTIGDHLCQIWKSTFWKMLRITDDWHIAQDIASNTVLTTLERYDSIRKENDGVHRFAYGVSRNFLLKHVCPRRETALPIDEFLESSVYQSNNSPDDNLLEKERNQLLLAAIRELPTKQREAFSLSFVEGLNPAQIAEALQISPNAVKNRLFQARQNLKKNSLLKEIAK